MAFQSKRSAFLYLVFEASLKTFAKTRLPDTDSGRFASGPPAGVQETLPSGDDAFALILSNSEAGPNNPRSQTLLTCSRFWFVEYLVIPQR